MTITKTKNGTYRLRIYIPEEARSSLGTGKKVIEKRFKLRSEAKKYELDMRNKSDKILSGERLSEFDTNGNIRCSITFGGNLTKQGRQPVQLNRLQKLQ